MEETLDFIEDDLDFFRQEIKDMIQYNRQQ